MVEKLEVTSGDWLETVEQDKEQIIDEVANQLSKEHPWLFSNISMDQDTQKELQQLVSNAVLTREDLAPEEAKDVIQTIIGQASGYGVLQDFFTPEAEDITEIFINPSADGPKVFYGRNGKTHTASKQYFRNNEDVLRYCQKICEDVGRPFTEDASIVDAWLSDGSRIAAIGFKTSPLGVTATIRKSPLRRPPMPLEKLVEFDTLPQFAADMIADLIVTGKANVGVFGRTDSGKTTFLRSMATFIDPVDRTFIAETSLEMFMPHLPNCINLTEVVYGDTTIVDMSQLCRTMNRNNPDRSIVGEIRSKEIIAASQIASSTSGGFWTTGHAGDINDLRTRLFGMFLDGGVQLPKDFLNETISSMFHFLIFLDKETMTKDKKRTLMSIEEVTPNGYKTIIRFDKEKFAETKGEVRRWVYENPISEEKLSKMAFNGAPIKPEYEKPSYKYLYKNEVTKE